MITKKEREEVLTKIEKLMAHTKIGTNGAVNINEMATANKLIKELMDKYEISIDEIKATSDKSTLVNKIEGTLFSGQTIEWASRLSSVVSRFYDCRVITSGKEKLFFIGFEMDAKVSLKMYDYLFIQINKGSYEATKTSSSVDKKLRRLDFCVGAVHSLSDRLKEIKNEREKQEIQNALVVVKKGVVDEQVNNMFPRLKYSNNNIKYNISKDYMNGVQFGKTVSIHKSELITK